MIKRVSKVAIAVCLLGSMPVWAVERATFILTSSEKISGTVVYHGDNRENLINGFLNIGVGDKEQTFPTAQVAVIDFIGGTPSNQELAALPGSGHLLALRDGTTRTGEFVNLIGGDTLKWREADGNVRDLPIGQVARVYLNPGSARNTFNYTAAPATTASTATAGTSGGGVSVRADQAWTNTGVVVRKGQSVRFSTSGEIKYAPGASDNAGPDGNAASKSPTLPVPAMNGGGLIGRVGTSAAFPIGSNQSAITMPADGTLMLGVNDDITTDNSGAFVVTITPGTVRR